MIDWYLSSFTMRKHIFLFSILLAGLATQAQDHKWIVSFTPAVVSTTSIHYGLQFGVGYKLNPRMSLLTEFTVITGQSRDSSTSASRYFRIKPAFRYFLSGRNSALKTYTSLQLSYTFRKWNDLDGGSYFEGNSLHDSAIVFSSAALHSPVMTSSVQLGTLINISDRFCLDLFLGLGIRVINTDYSQVENSSKVFAVKPKCKILITPDPAYWVDGTISRVHFNTGFRLLFYF